MSRHCHWQTQISWAGRLDLHHWEPISIWMPRLDPAHTHWIPYPFLSVFIINKPADHPVYMWRMLHHVLHHNAKSIEVCNPLKYFFIQVFPKFKLSWQICLICLFLLLNLTNLAQFSQNLKYLKYIKI